MKRFLIWSVALTGCGVLLVPAAISVGPVPADAPRRCRGNRPLGDASKRHGRGPVRARSFIRFARGKSTVGHHRRGSARLASLLQPERFTGQLAVDPGVYLRRARTLVGAAGARILARGRAALPALGG